MYYIFIAEEVTIIPGFAYYLRIHVGFPTTPFGNLCTSVKTQKRKI
jgi:hypothetical protein